ncbi:hypothetical protein GGQ87_001371 [Brevundimonas alba]|uniref:Uncharacterized protein n=1 Tax=Brevundimonas alba TaxID=74314 RepID=A0A7X5YJV8_9CAUL|nr:hypothetical protein [Brevundimonas alba]NJC41113.1 hypothetical protein [Brevundimonas alba]
MAAVLLFAVTPAAASTTEPPPAVQSLEVQAADMQDWLGRSAAWSAPYTAMIDQRADRLVSLGQGKDHVLNLLNAVKNREARSWAVRWAAEQRAGMAAEYEAFSGLPPTPPPLPATISTDPALRQSAQSLVELRDRIGTLLRQTQSSGETYIDLVVAASSGRAGDLAALDGGHYAVLEAHLEAEILMLTATRGPVGEPNYYFSNAMAEANRVAITWLQLNRAIVLGQPFDRAGTVRRMREHAALSREAADDMTLSTTRTKQMLDNEPDLVGTPLYQALMPMLESLYRSAELERQIADQNVALAAATEANDGNAQNAVVAKAEVLVAERAAEFSRRQLMLAAMQ